MKNNDSDDDMPPELEDVPEDMLAATKKKETNTFIGDYTEEKSDAPRPTWEETKKPEEVKPGAKKEASLSGLKKGFFDSAPAKKKAAEPKKEEPVLIKPTQDKDDWKRFPEVQQSMKQTIIDKKDQWMTPDLINKIQQNPSLIKLFTNPEYMQAITQMQTNPQAVMEKYKNNAEFTQLMVEFSKIMGGHFTKIGEQEKKQEQQKVAPPVDKEVDEILKDPKIKSLIAYLQRNERVDFHRVMQSDPSIAMKLQVLINKGYINIGQ